MILGRLNKYSNKAFAMYIADKTGGMFINETYHDKYGDFWVVIWR